MKWTRQRENESEGKRGTQRVARETHKEYRTEKKRTKERQKNTLLISNHVPSHNFSVMSVFFSLALLHAVCCHSNWPCTQLGNRYNARICFYLLALSRAHTHAPCVCPPCHAVWLHQIRGTYIPFRAWIRHYITGHLWWIITARSHNRKNKEYEYEGSARVCRIVLCCVTLSLDPNTHTQRTVYHGTCMNA